MPAKLLIPLLLAATVVLTSAGEALAARPRRGACCLPSGDCKVMLRSRCLTARGHFRGVRKACTPHACDRVGACIMRNGVCAIRTRAGCRASHGDYRGNGTSCQPSPPPDTTPPDGPGTDPPPINRGPDLVLVGACCFRDQGLCSLMLFDACRAANGFFLGPGTVCSTTACRPPSGGCCLGGDICVVVTQTDCAQSGGLYRGDATACDTAQCGTSLGACCFADGSCQARTVEDCSGLPGAAFHGAGTTCLSTVCSTNVSGSCCFPPGFCEVITSGECLDRQGWYRGAGVSCETARCWEIAGACCHGDTACVISDSAPCLNTGGLFRGPATTCSVRLCTSPPCPCDWNADGSLDIQDVFDWYFDVQAGGGDLDGDGDFDDEDANEFLTCFRFPPPACR